MINGYGVNGAYTPAWVVRAAVVAVAAAAAVTAAPTRILPATAYGNANVVVSLSQIKTVAAFATATGDATSSVLPSLRYAGRVNATGQATGTAIVYRAVPATAAGDASATGIALANAKLGNATATSASTTVLCQAHRIRPAASSQVATLTAVPAAAKVTRYSPVSASAEATGRGEASKKLSGQSYFRHDGYVLGAAATCTVTVEQDKTKIIATLGSFDFANSTGAATSFLRRRGASYSLGVSTALSVVGVRKALANATANATASSTVTPTKTNPAAALGLATAVKVSLAVSQRHAGSAAGEATLSDVLVSAKRTARALVTGTAQAQSLAVVYGRQFFDVAGGVAGVSSQVSPSILYYAQAIGLPVALANSPLTGLQNFGQIFAQAGASAAPVGVKLFANVVGTATATGSAGGVTLSDKPAPEERQMNLSDDDRAMLVASEDRIMVVPS